MEEAQLSSPGWAPSMRLSWSKPLPSAQAGARLQPPNRALAEKSKSPFRSHRKINFYVSEKPPLNCRIYETPAVARANCCLEHVRRHVVDGGQLHRTLERKR